MFCHDKRREKSLFGMKEAENMKEESERDVLSRRRRARKMVCHEGGE